MEPGCAGRRGGLREDGPEHGLGTLARQQGTGPAGRAAGGVRGAVDEHGCTGHPVKVAGEGERRLAGLRELGHGHRGRDEAVRVRAGELGQSGPLTGLEVVHPGGVSRAAPSPSPSPLTVSTTWCSTRERQLKPAAV